MNLFLRLHHDSRPAIPMGNWDRGTLQRAYDIVAEQEAEHGWLLDAETFKAASLFVRVDHRLSMAVDVDISDVQPQRAARRGMREH